MITKTKTRSISSTKMNTLKNKNRNFFSVSITQNTWLQYLFVSSVQWTADLKVSFRNIFITKTVFVPICISCCGRQCMTGYGCSRSWGCITRPRTKRVQVRVYLEPGLKSFVCTNQTLFDKQTRKQIYTMLNVIQ